MIAEQTSKSLRTVEANLLGDKYNPEIARLAYKYAFELWDSLGKVLAAIEKENQREFLTAEELNNQRNNMLWTRRPEYMRHMDVYIQLAHRKIESIEEAWAAIQEVAPDLLDANYYCADLIHRLVGQQVKTVVDFLNKKNGW